MDNYPIPGFVMPRRPVQDPSTSQHPTRQTYWPYTFPLPHPALSSSWRSNGLRADLREEDHAPSFIRSTLNGVPHIVCMTTRPPLLLLLLQLRHCAITHSFLWGMWKVMLHTSHVPCSQNFAPPASSYHHKHPSCLLPLSLGPSRP